MAFKGLDSDPYYGNWKDYKSYELPFGWRLHALDSPTTFVVYVSRECPDAKCRYVSDLHKHYAKYDNDQIADLLIALDRLEAEI